MSSPAIEFARQNYPRFLDELKALLRIPSISTLPEHKDDCRKAAEVLATELKRIGMENVRLIETEGHPLVYADWLHAAGKPTVLMYGHYDVQPTDPIDEWLSPPFEPTVRDGNIYARGAVDDKGQVVAQVKALESLLATTGKLPLNVRMLLEGEEEVGGEGIASFVASKPPELKADFALVSDTELFAPGLPTLCVGLRGMIYTELEVRSARSDLHSGMYGGAAPNSFVSLAQILAKLKDENGHILIPGFYDDIIPPSPEELAAWKSLPFDEEGLQRAGTHLGAADGRCARDSRWLYGRGREDGDPRQGDGQGLHAAGSGHDSGQGVRALQKLRGKNRAGRRGRGGAADSLWRSVPDSGEQPVHPGGDAGSARGLGQGHGVYPLRRVDPDCGRLRPPPGAAQRNDGLRIAGRQPSCSE
jgi:acetylornithine deacetylase/succinyl-diaminopimelate desuccinylase-like protein